MALEHRGLRSDLLGGLVAHGLHDETVLLVARLRSFRGEANVRRAEIAHETALTVDMMEHLFERIFA